MFDGVDLRAGRMEVVLNGTKKYAFTKYSFGINYSQFASHPENDFLE